MAKTLLNKSESVLFGLRNLYGRSGYSHYKMNKFEEYDLYANNKDFLISEGVITFTDGNGKLLALKPDVTLSIVKNTKDNGNINKLFYDENVYRISKGSGNFREIMQVGLECIGSVDEYCVYEVIDLALRSLGTIKETNILSVSHLGIISEIMDYYDIPYDKREKMISLIGEKNSHELSDLLSKAGKSDECIKTFSSLIRLNGKTEKIISDLYGLLKGKVSEKTLCEFSSCVCHFKNDPHFNIDFSVVGDIRYYNGFIFKGYVEGIPSSVLSGGQYDMLMKKMGRSSKAIGFAVYLDLIGQYLETSNEYDVDSVLVYCEKDRPEDIRRESLILSEKDGSVISLKKIPDNFKYRKLYKMNDGRAEIIE